MKSLTIIFFLLIFSNLITYHITKFSTTSEVIGNSKKRMMEALFLIDDPKFNQTNETFKSETFNALNPYGWNVIETEKSYTLSYLDRHQWEISKKKEE